MKALPINVYRSSKIGDCTNGGISGKYDTLLIACDEGFIDIDPENVPENFAMVELRHVFGNTIIPTIYPADIAPNGNVVPREGKWWMMGGNYGATSDSRFSRMIGGYYGAVAIHDRYETPEEYDRYSR